MISIVMPTYNQGRYIREAVESVLAQSYWDIELIIVNDGSTDDTQEYLNTLTDPRVSVFLKTNGGTGSALNYGFKYATGEFETWFASDNVMFPSCIETLVNKIGGADFIYGNCEIRTMDPTGERVIATKNLLAEVKTQDWSFDRFMQGYHLGICWLWRRELRDRAGREFQLEPCEDYDMTLRMAQCGGVFVHTPECLGWFRRHLENLSHKCAQGGHKATLHVLAKARARARVYAHTPH